MAQFDNGPGYKKICAGEYELFNTLDSSQIISRAESEALTPGLSITMAIIVGQYHYGNFNRCPRPGCKSDSFTSNESGGKTWYTLHAFCIPCELKSCKLIPLPKSHLQGFFRPCSEDSTTSVTTSRHQLRSIPPSNGDGRENVQEFSDATDPSGCGPQMSSTRVSNETAHEIGQSRPASPEVP